jgi:hypothetical protein
MYPMTSETITQALNFVTSADVPGDVVFRLTDESGNPVDSKLFTNPDGDPLYLSNQPLSLHYGDDAKHLVAETADGEIAFTATINDDGTVSTTIFTGIMITDVELTSVTDLSGIGGGNVPFKGLNLGTSNKPEGIPDNDVLVSSEIYVPEGEEDPGSGTVNSTAAVLGVGQGEEISAGEVIRYDLVTGLIVEDKQHQESYDFSGYQSTHSFKQYITVAGSGKDADFVLRLYNESEVPTEPQRESMVRGVVGPTTVSLIPGDVTIYNADGIEQSEAGHINYHEDGYATISNMLDGWYFIVTPVHDESPVAFNALEIHAIEPLDDSLTTSFKLSQFAYGEDTDVNPVNFELPVTGTDFDGDSVYSTVDFTVYPDTKSIEGTAQDDSGQKTLLGTEQDDYLFGYEGDDVLIGDKGDDILIGGEGDDTFKWQAGDEGEADTPAYDQVMDFHLGHDALDLGDQLTGADMGDLDALLSHYIGLNVDDSGTKVTLNIDISGGGDFVNADQVIDLNIVGGTLGESDQAILDSLLNPANHVEPEL